MASASEGKSSSSGTMDMVYVVLSALYIVAAFQLVYKACIAAYEIRLFAIKEYGRVIHEFDPYFNYRAAEYLWQHGTKKFFNWFDYQSWYPLGRPVGTTIYPGMQFTSVWIKQFILPNWSINDICCFVPAWFGVTATLCTAGLCYTTVSSIRTTKGTKSILLDIPIVEGIVRLILLPIFDAFKKVLHSTTGSTWGLPTLKNPPALESAVFTALIMSIVPAHLMRSVGGGYDNESVATTAMQLTFWMWCCSLSASSLTMATILGVVTGFAYFYMVAAWGGYIYVINLIGLSALAVFILRKLPFDHLYRSYSSFYLVGTFLAMQIPVVNWTPLKSLEQLGPCGVFVGFQFWQAMCYLEKKYPKKNPWVLRGQVVLVGSVAALPVFYLLYSSGYFGPISSRIRGLFVKHTKTGNPLVDSVAEHQPASVEAYQQYLHVVCQLAPIGFGIIATIGCTASSSFLLVYGVTAYFFSHKMVRLILLTAPIASICGGIALGYFWAWTMESIFDNKRPSLEYLLDMSEDDTENNTIPQSNSAPAKTDSDKGKGKKNSKESKAKTSSGQGAPVNTSAQTRSGNPIWIRAIRLLAASLVIKKMIPHAKDFKQRSNQMAKAISHPTIITKGRNRETGEDVLVDDYRDAYFWLRDNSPEDARVMAWWDYGYQITGIANRTTIADGNTWNHEHIALLGRTLTSSEKEGHRIARHLADYVLIWAGGGGDDLAKSPHLRRIANSVYRGLCKEPLCRAFGMTRTGAPSEQLGESLLYKLHSNKVVAGVEVDSNRFKEVYRTKFGKVRIYKVLSVSKESKQWVIDNRKCDTEGSWFCPGHYPPALEKILNEKRDFQQLEDFNKEGEDESYQQAYFENLGKPRGLASEDSGPVKDGEKRYTAKLLPERDIARINENWEDNEKTTLMWQLVSSGALNEFARILVEQPELAHVRSSDGRGPLWWAHEHNRPRMIDVLKQLGVSEDLKDAKGITPPEART